MRFSSRCSTRIGARARQHGKQPFRVRAAFPDPGRPAFTRRNPNGCSPWHRLPGDRFARSPPIAPPRSGNLFGDRSRWKGAVHPSGPPETSQGSRPAHGAGRPAAEVARIGMSLAAEAWPPSKRARASSYVGLGWEAGVLLAAWLTPLLLPVIGGGWLRSDRHRWPGREILLQRGDRPARVDLRLRYLRNGVFDSRAQRQPAGVGGPDSQMLE
jgi:hypothetical protein